MSSAEPLSPPTSRAVRRFAVAWRNRHLRVITPVGELDYRAGGYRFQYLEGVGGSVAVDTMFILPIWAGSNGSNSAGAVRVLSTTTAVFVPKLLSPDRFGRVQPPAGAPERRRSPTKVVRTAAPPARSPLRGGAVRRRRPTAARRRRGR